MDYVDDLRGKKEDLETNKLSWLFMTASDDDDDDDDEGEGDYDNHDYDDEGGDIFTLA